MNGHDSTSAIYLSRHLSPYVEEIIQTAVNWNLDEVKRIKVLSSINEMKQAFSEEQISNFQKDYLLTRALTSSWTIQRMIKEAGGCLSEQSVNLLRHWQKEQVGWTLFTITEVQDDGFFLIFDEELLFEQLLYSPQLAGTSPTIGELFLSLTFSNTACLEPLGNIHTYQNLKIMDISFFLKGLNPGLYESRGISGVISNHFIDFLRLQSADTRPAQSCFFSVDPLNNSHFSEKLPGTWEHVHLDEETELYRYLAPDDDMSDYSYIAERFLEDRKLEDFWKPEGLFPPEYYVNVKEGISALLADGAHDLLVVRSLILLHTPDDKSNDVLSILDLAESNTAVSAAKQVPGFKFPWIFRMKKGVSPERQMKERFRLAVVLFLDGKEPFDEEIWAERMFASEDAVLADVYFIAKSHFIALIPYDDWEYTLPDVSIPLQSKRSKGLCEGGLFTVRDDPGIIDTFSLYAGSGKAADIDDLIDFIEDLFFDCFDEDLAYPVMNSLFHILIRQKDQWHPARTFALEVYKILYQEVEDRDEFITSLVKFIYRKLCTNGMCEVPRRPKGDERITGTVPVRGTPFLRKFLLYEHPAPKR